MNVQNFLNNSHTYKIPINFLQNCTYEKPISKIIISNSTRSPLENIIEIGFECHRIIFSFDDFTVCSIFASPTDMCEGSKNCYHKIQISKSNQNYQSFVLFQSFASPIWGMWEAYDCLNLSNQINFSIRYQIELSFCFKHKHNIHNCNFFHFTLRVLLIGFLLCR